MRLRHPRRYAYPDTAADSVRFMVQSFAEYERVKNAAHMYARRRGQKFATRRRGEIVIIRRTA